VVPGDTLAGEARAMATRLAALAPGALAATKHALDLAWSLDLDRAMANEARLQGLAGASADHAEGMTAFLEKRPPRFTGS
jgi:2-(1,2-epoxy-1,2-dihydrophenyl)acetyl-CoA isomerase